MKIKSGSLDPDPDLFIVNTGPETVSLNRNNSKILIEMGRKLRFGQSYKHAKQIYTFVTSFVKINDPRVL
jgi:hypothetical protein